MELLGKILLGFFVGALCGLIPLIHGILIYHKLNAIIGMVTSSLTGVLFSVLNKSPFTSMVVAILFVVINIAALKRKEKNEQNNNDDENENDQ